MAISDIEIPIEGGSLVPAARASSSDPTAGVVLLVPDIFGRTPFYERLLEDLAADGFQAVLVDPFYALGPLQEPTLEAAFARRRRLDEAAAVEMLRAVVGSLRDFPGAAARTGTVGFCMGGTFVLDLAAFESDLATVAFYGFPNLYPGLAHPPPRPLDLVDRLSGPILALWGENDTEVGMDNVTVFLERCRAAGVDVDARILPRLGHSFMTATPASETELQEQVRAAWDDARAHLRAGVGATS